MSEPSKYDSLARRLRDELGAEAVLLVVVGGCVGSGAARVEIAAQLAEPDKLHASRQLQIRALRMLADDIERGITQPDQAWARRGQS